MPYTSSDIPKTFSPHVAPASPGRPSPSSDDDELDLKPYLHMLWRFRLFVIVLPVAAFVAAYLASRTMTPQYLGTAKVWVTSSKIGEESAVLLNVASFRPLLENRSLAASVVKDLRLDQPPYNITATAFVSDLLTVENLRDTNVLVITVRLPDPKLAADAANRLAAHAVELGASLSRDDILAARDTIKTQVDEARLHLETASKERDAYRRQAQVELLRKDVDTLLGQRGELRKLLVEIAGERARLAQAEAQLKLKQPTDTLRRSLDSNPAMMEAVRDRAPDAKSLLPLELRDEVQNPVYKILEEEVAMIRTDVSALEHSRDQLTKSVSLNDPGLRQLSTLYVHESQLLRLDTEFELAKAGYIQLSNRLQQADLLVASRSAQLQILDPALPPIAPVWPRPFRTAAMVAVAVLMLTVFAAFAVQYARSMSSYSAPAR